MRLQKEEIAWLGKRSKTTFWVTKIDTHDDIGIDHIHQFFYLWERISNTQLTYGIPNSIS
jgi:hypothetical protein